MDWRRVQEVHDSFSYNSSGLGVGAQLAIAIVMAAYVGPVALNAMGGGTVAAGGAAVATGAATNASISLVNNRGDLGAVWQDTTSSDALKGYAISGITAGLTQGYFNDWTGAPSDITGKITIDLGSLKGIGQFAASQGLQNGTALALGRIMGQGGDLGDALQSTLLNTLAAVSFNAVGDYTKGVYADGSIQKVMIHAMVGGLLAEASGGDFKTGALAAGANEALVDQLDTWVGGDKVLLDMTSQLVGLLAASTLDGADAQSLQTGAWVAQNATQYNYLNHDDGEGFVDAMQQCGNDESCQRKQWDSNFSQLSQANFDEAMATGGGVWAKDQMLQIAGGLAALDSLACTTTACEQYKFTLIDRGLTSYARLADVAGEWEPVLGAIGGVAAGVAGSRPSGNGSRPLGSTPTVGSAQVEKAYAYWVKAKADGVKGVSKLPVPSDLPKTIHMGQQGKHIKGHSNFIAGRSYFNDGIDPIELLNGVHSGKYPIVGAGARGNPIVDFGRPIGVDGRTGMTVTKGQIHYGKNGVHIVPDARN